MLTLNLDARAECQEIVHLIDIGIQHADATLGMGGSDGLGIGGAVDAEAVADIDPAFPEGIEGIVSIDDVTIDAVIGGIFEFFADEEFADGGAILLADADLVLFDVEAVVVDGEFEVGEIDGGGEGALEDFQLFAGADFPGIDLIEFGEESPTDLVLFGDVGEAVTRLDEVGFLVVGLGGEVDLLGETFQIFLEEFAVFGELPVPVGEDFVGFGFLAVLDHAANGIEIEINAGVVSEDFFRPLPLRE